MKKLFKFVAFALVASLVAGGGIWYTETRASGADVSYRTARVRRGSLRSTIQATGTLSAEETVDVGTQISGTIREIYVDYNDKVTEGQLIAVMDSRTQQADVDMARANVLSAKADLAKANAKLLKANRDLNRTRQLVKKDLIARSELDADVAEQATAKADLMAAQARVAQYEATLRKQEINLGYTKIYSPVDGVVVAKNVEKGQTVAASYQTPSIAEIARDLKQMQVEVNVDEADIGSVKVGQKAEFTVDAFTDTTFRGQVTQVRISPKSSNSVVSYTVIVKVNNDEEKLMPGMTANVSLIVTEKNDILLVPNAALRFRPNVNTEIQMGPRRRGGNVAAVETPGVYVMMNKKPVKIEVEKGITDGTRTEILSGVEEGTEVLVGFNLQSDKKK
ncbi:MAG: efflux RND transporter periplasmic adaptor subunit [Pyramidobacter sp.]|jgi:HlyD family secretion protein|nr:efflux RND transporter periplasmic adaptor subunit [Pyramidobacter sp.]MBQ9423201.1 efflux RND transporter periplasmic adaptor subunit [Pyramidobacter sp.]MBR0108338.1 efflux RND transporter periplasmic adaptor subunit [Pyramidobacter sp.]